MGYDQSAFGELNGISELIASTLQPIFDLFQEHQRTPR